ncbi:MAG: MBOAT family O-acyltransferase [Saprospiraceae bacterium]|nr:MBOAT family O-acyltransferase [Saprospiraceae bacterium]
MLFNSIEFGVFLIVVFLLYWFVFNRNLRIQNTFLLISSYFFYGWWDWRFLILIFISSVTDYFVGRAMYKAEGARRKWLLYLSLGVNLGMLGFFKYYNFFVESFVEAYTFLGASLEVDRLNIILPVGISFYTFQTLSYSLDIYKDRLKPTDNFISFLGFVSFFPQLVAGPIERARRLLPQFEKPRVFDGVKARDGMRQILWGLFKKVVVADNCALLGYFIYHSAENYSGSTILMAFMLIGIHVYADFSGYSDIAIGTARLFGFRLSKNFNFPYFAKSIPELWRKWHISLTTWFTDYIFIPMTLRAKKRTNFVKFRNTVILFTLIGLWHGASWSFVLFGFMNGLMFFRSIYFKDFSLAQVIGIPDDNYILNTMRRFQTFVLFVVASAFFPNHLMHGIESLGKIFSFSLFTFPQHLSFFLIFIISSCFIVEWFQRDKEHGLDFTGLILPQWKRYAIYSAVIFGIFLLKAPKTDFIYFQF